MKKMVLMAVFAIASLSVFSCEKKSDKEMTNKEGEATHERKSTGSPHNDAKRREHKEGETEVAYKCPMDCEKGKTYDKPGKCPKCEMNLAEAKHGNHNDH